MISVRRNEASKPKRGRASIEDSSDFAAPAVSAEPPSGGSPTGSLGRPGTGPRGSNRELVIIPTDPISAYEAKGLTWLAEYYNPAATFDRVTALSPIEVTRRQAWGLDIMPCPVWRFREAIARLRPNVVRAYGGYWPADLAVSTRVRGIPIVVSVHDTTNVHPSVRLADLVICMSKAVLEKVLEHGTDPARTRILPNRVDLETFRPSSAEERRRLQAQLAQRFGQPGRCVLHIGRKSEQKNLDTVLRCLPLLPSDVWLLAIGQPRSTPEYDRLARELGVSERVVWVDRIANDELPSIYNAVSALVVPSRWEGFGVVFIEAAACGTPIVTSDIAPMNEYLSHQESAVLVREFENQSSLAAAIREVLDDEVTTGTLRANGPRAATPFSRAEVDRRERQYYEAVMGVPARVYTVREAEHARTLLIDQVSRDVRRRLRRYRRSISRWIGRE